jgi:predicted PurR-regulated permease PerM
MRKFNSDTVNSSFYTKASLILMGLVALFFIIYVGQQILIPIVFSIILSILLNPFVNFLTKRRFNRALAILLVELVGVILAGALIVFIVSQLSHLGDNLPQLKQKLNGAFRDIVNWAATTFNQSEWKVEQWLDQTTEKGMENSSGVISQTLVTIQHVAVNVVLIPVYVFMILYYKVLILTFISKVFKQESHSTVVDVLTEVKSLIQSYLVGLMLEAGIIAALNTTALFIIGVKYAFLLGICCALLNLIPYIGGLIAMCLLMLFAFLTKSAGSAVVVMFVHMTIQLIDNNFLVPKIVGSKVKINALASILAVLVGGAMCGIPGMFLSIPVIAVFKVICDRVRSLEPLGYLLGDTMPHIGNSIFKYIKPR